MSPQYITRVTVSRSNRPSILRQGLERPEEESYRKDKDLDTGKNPQTIVTLIKTH